MDKPVITQHTPDYASWYTRCQHIKVCNSFEIEKSKFNDGVSKKRPHRTIKNHPRGKREREVFV